VLVRCWLVTQVQVFKCSGGAVVRLVAALQRCCGVAAVRVCSLLRRCCFSQAVVQWRSGEEDALVSVLCVAARRWVWQGRTAAAQGSSMRSGGATTWTAQVSHPASALFVRQCARAKRTPPHLSARAEHGRTADAFAITHRTAAVGRVFTPWH